MDQSALSFIASETTENHPKYYELPSTVEKLGIYAVFFAAKQFASFEFDKAEHYTC